MRRTPHYVLGCLFALGLLFHLVGAGEAFIPLAGSLLALALAGGGIMIMLNIKKVEEVLKFVAGAALALLFGPPFVVGLGRELWTAHPMLFLVLVGVAVLAGVHVTRHLRPRRVAAQALRSGGGRAVPVPRRWRQP